MDIVKYKVRDLKMAEYNPRQLNVDQEAALKDSLEKFGFVDPLIVNVNKDRKNVLIGGHQRLRIAKILGHKEVPCVELNLDIKQERELNIRLNKNTGQWDWDMLANYFDVDELTDWGFTEDFLFETSNDIEEDKFSVPKSSDDDYSTFELIMLHDNKLQLMEVLNDVKSKYALDKQEDALMEIVRQYKKGEE